MKSWSALAMPPRCLGQALVSTGELFGNADFQALPLDLLNQSLF